MRSKVSTTGVAALVLAGSIVVGGAAPANAATSCLNVPAATPGFTVGVGGQQHRIPTLSGIVVCASTPDSLPAAPVASNTVGGACTTSCTTISLQVSPVDVGPLSVSYMQDGVRTTHAVDPAAVGSSTSVCLISVGTPQAPVPSCTLSLGSDQDLLGTVNGLISQATTLANQKLGEASALAGGVVSQATTLANQTVAQATATANEAVSSATRLVDDVRADAEALAAEVDALVRDVETFVTDPGLIPRLLQVVECILDPGTC